MKLRKYFKNGILMVIICYILAVIISIVMMNQMTKIIYNATAYGTTIREDIIDFKTNIAQRDCYDFYGKLTEHKENQISSIKEFEIKSICAFSLFPLWRKDYSNPSIMDGDQYKIIRSYKESENYIYGSNAYPLTYRFVLWVIENSFI